MNFPCLFAPVKKPGCDHLSGRDLYIYLPPMVAQMLKNLPAMQETQVLSLGLEGSLEKETVTHPVFLPGEFHGERSLAGYSPYGSKVLDMTR